MAIPAAYIQELIGRNNIYDVVSRHVSLQRAGRLYKGLCPFHSERSPSFMVYPETQSYYCFGCNKGGDAIKFTMEINSLSYVEAVRLMAQNSGMPMPDEDDGQAKLKSRIYRMNKLAARFFFDTLKSDKGIEARRYLAERQLTAKTVTHFGLGYAGDDWQGLCDYLRSQGYTDKEIETAYFAKRNKNGKLYDVFRGRVMFPILDTRGNVIAFGGRRMGDGDGPKYLNSGDTPVFKKSNGLFALNFARKSGKDALILCEGYMDVIAMHQAGFENAVATLGTALTQQQAKLIGDYAKKVIISYDSDGAGQKATRRAMEMFVKEDVAVQVLQMDGAKDPDEYIKKFGAERFEALINGASSALDFQLMKIKRNYDIQIPEQRAEYLTKACQVLAGLKNAIQQDVYSQRLADETNTEKISILKMVERFQRQQKKYRERERENQLVNSGIASTIKVDYSRKGNTLPRVFAQQQIVCALVRDNKLYNMVSEKLTRDNFTDPGMKQAFVGFENLVNQGVDVTYSVLCANLDDETKNVLSGVFARNAEIVLNSNDVQLHINNLLNSNLTRAEVSESSLEDIARRIRAMKDRKK